jgi:hypothetical protein
MKGADLADAVAAVVRAATDPLHARIKRLEAEVAAMKAAQGSDSAAVAAAIRDRLQPGARP